MKGRPRAASRSRGVPASTARAATTSAVAGATVVEVLVALVLTTVLLQLSVDTLARLKATARSHDEVRTELGAQRLASRILRSELTAGMPERDWIAYPPDSVRLRAFRVTAEVCGPVGDSTLVVRPRGGRQVDPDKDSVLVLDGSGQWHPHDLTSRAVDPAACAGGGGEVWGLGTAPPETSVMARAFESGSYHLGPAELRYRRGGSGRQPITGPGLGGFVFSEGTSGLSLHRPDSVPSTRLGLR